MPSYLLLHFNECSKMYIFKAAALHFMDFMWLLKCAIEIRLYRALEHLEKELVVLDLWGVLSLFRAAESLHFAICNRTENLDKDTDSRAALFMDSSSSSYFSVQNSIGRTQRETHHPKNLLLLLLRLGCYWCIERKNIEQKIVEQHSDDAIIIIQSPAVFAFEQQN